MENRHLRRVRHRSRLHPLVNPVHAAFCKAGALPSLSTAAFQALMGGIADVTPAPIDAAIHRALSEPGSADKE
ncbi:hypothetical protein [Novosphingobium soli]|uniref:Uncharacterized protein n=1 Tax=Novosphingobium soli TaxID=574956 RepID=A0ABV6CZC7_9SPHN